MTEIKMVDREKELFRFHGFFQSNKTGPRNNNTSVPVMLTREDDVVKNNNAQYEIIVINARIYNPPAR